jgi:hypothetical protein
LRQAEIAEFQRIKPHQTASNRIKPHQTASNRIKPHQTASNRIKPYQAHQYKRVCQNERYVGR